MTKKANPAQGVDAMTRDDAIKEVKHLTAKVGHLEAERLVMQSQVAALRSSLRLAHQKLGEVVAECGVTVRDSGASQTSAWSAAMVDGKMKWSALGPDVGEA